MKNNFAIRLKNVSMSYKLYDKHKDRMKEALHPFRKKYHRDFFALRNINLDIEKGEILGIVGINGAGKSTLLKIISGVLQPTSGSLQVNGTIASILELGSGMNPEYTGMENIYFYCSILGFKKDEIDNMLNEIIAFAEIGEFIHQPIKIYSSGMKARLAFAINTTVNPDILILDEVLAVGDILFKRKCFARIEKLLNDGKTVVFVSHSSQSIIEFCTRAILLHEREIIMDDTPKKVTDFYQKLVFSKDKKKVINEINGKTQIDSKVEQKETKVNKKFYLPDLKSSPIEYRNYDINIFDIMILDKESKKVNILKTGKEYIYTYKVKFNNNYRNVAFGLKLKTKTGMELTSISTHMGKNKLINVNKNDIYHITNSFVCNLLYGYYFLNSGVSVHPEDENMFFLNRIIDSYLFKVIQDQDSMIRGIINQNNTFEIKRVS